MIEIQWWIVVGLAIGLIVSILYNRELNAHGKYYFKLYKQVRDELFRSQRQIEEMAKELYNDEG